MDQRYTARLDFTAAFAPLESCPGCGSRQLTAVVVAERTIFRCNACRAYWHLELGRVARIDNDRRGSQSEELGTTGATRPMPKGPACVSD